MPCLEVKVNVENDAYQKSVATFIESITESLAKVLGKSKQYLMISCSRGEVAMGGQLSIPTAYCKLNYLGPLSNDNDELTTNKQISECIATELNKSFNVSNDRYFLVIEETERINWGYKSDIPFYKPPQPKVEEKKEEEDKIEIPQIELLSAKGYKDQTFLELVTKIDDNKTNKSQLPLLGLGTWLSKPGKVRAAVEYGLKLGYRHIDCAAIYANETEVGQGIANAIKAGIKREDIFITSKLWNTKHDPKDVIPALKKTLSDLGLDYVDLYLIHWPITLKAGDEKFPKTEDGKLDYGAIVPHEETWMAMEECVKQGLTKHIGLSNFNESQIDNVLKKCTIRPSVLQCEGHPYLAQNGLRKYCKENNIILQAYSPLGNPQRPKGWDHTLKSVMENEEIAKIAKECGVSVANVCIRYQIDRGVICLAKSVTPSRILANFEGTWKFKLNESQLEILGKLDCNNRYCVPTVVDEETGKRVVRDKDHPFWPWNDTIYD